MADHDFILSAAYLGWGLLVHWLGDWAGQNDWMANNKSNLRHLAGYVHAGIHGLLLWLVFPWYAALALGVAHLLIDTRKPVAWWSKLIRQTQPTGKGLPLVDVGMYVRFETDQVFHYGCIAIAALAVAYGG